MATALSPSTAPAQSDTTAAPLTLHEAVRLAIADYPTVAAAALRVVEADAAVGEATAARYPAVALAGSVVRYDEPMLVTPIHGFAPDLLPPFDETLIQGGATFTYTLYDGGARGSRVGQARAGAAAASAGHAMAQQALVARVVNAFATVLTQRQVLGATDRMLAALRAEGSRAMQRVAAGRGAELEVFRADASIAAAEAARVRVSAALDLGVLELSRLTGWSAQRIRGGALAEIAVSDQGLPTRELLVGRALEANPALAQTRQEFRAAEAGVAVARGAWLPDIKLFGAYIDRGSANTDFDGEWSAGATLTYPLFTGGGRSSRVKRAEAWRGVSAEQVRLAELRIAEEVDRAVAQVAEVQARAEALRRSEVSLEEVARIELLALEAGAGTQTDYLRAEADLLAVRAEVAGAYYGEVVALAELARTTGALTPDWVATNVESTP
ncbi:MAG TPA: TolC family protein [Gemmatimonadales bacterium]|nr:TolC family protein [Gemmatimonadales bacterium]